MGPSVSRMDVDDPVFLRARSEVRHRLAENLRAIRARLGLSQEKAAERVGVSLQYLQRIERERHGVPLDTLAAFAVSLGVDAAELLKPVRAPVTPRRRGGRRAPTAGAHVRRAHGRRSVGETGRRAGLDQSGAILMPNMPPTAAPHASRSACAAASSGGFASPT